MARVCVEAEKEDMLAVERRREAPPPDVEEAIARATIFTANSLNIKAVAAMTQSGKTVLLMSRLPTHVPIYAMSSVAGDAPQGDAVPRRLPGQVQGRARPGESAATWPRTSC